MDTVHKTRGAPPAGQRLTRTAVLDRAAELLERDGAAAFSLRSLARELNVRPAALYNHVEGLDDLLDAVAARFVAGLELAEGNEPWPQWVAAVAGGLRARLLDHPELAGLMLARAPGTAEGPALLRRFIDRLVAAGVDRAVAHVAWHAVLTLVLGAVHQERARSRDQGDTFEAVLEITVAGLVAAAAEPSARAVALLAAHTAAHTAVH